MKEILICNIVKTPRVQYERRHHNYKQADWRIDILSNSDWVIANITTHLIKTPLFFDIALIEMKRMSNTVINMCYVYVIYQTNHNEILLNYLCCDLLQ